MVEWYMTKRRNFSLFVDRLLPQQWIPAINPFWWLTGILNGLVEGKTVYGLLVESQCRVNSVILYPFCYLQISNSGEIEFGGKFNSPAAIRPRSRFPPISTKEISPRFVATKEQPLQNGIYM